MICTKEFHFEAAHMLADYSGACKNLHGHSYKLQVSVGRSLSGDEDMVIDFNHIKTVVQAWIDTVDHAYIIGTKEVGIIKGANKVHFLEGSRSTAENILRDLADYLSTTNLSHFDLTLKLWETHDNCVTYCVPRSSDNEGK